MILIVVVGLAVVMATLAVVLVVRMRSDARESDLVLRHAQARLMLSAALMYVQESSRLGWDGVGVGDLDRTGETFGWTDARDGALGPRGARPVVGGITADGTGIDPRPEACVPTWWAALYGNSPIYQPYFTSADEANASVFPAPARRRWPLPGSVLRAEMPVWERPPYAIKPIFSANPVRPPVAYGDPAWATEWTATPGMNAAWLPDIFDPNQGALNMLDPQPVADTWSAFAAGDATLRPASQGLAWFRVYRELLSDHDNDPTNDVDYGILGGDPVAIAARSPDRVALYDPNDTTSDPPLRNYSVFIVTCGAGASRGYRFWSLPGNDPRRALEPVTAEESGLFPSEQVFNLIQQNEVVLWFRVEHTPRTNPSHGADLDRTRYVGNDSYNPPSGTNPSFTYPWPDFNGEEEARRKVRPAAARIGNDNTGNAMEQLGPGAASAVYGRTSLDLSTPLPNQGGGFRWIQRLDREPVKW